MSGEYDWYVLLVQYMHLKLKTSGSNLNEGYAWDIAFVKAVSEADATKKFKEHPKCGLAAFDIGPATEVLVHRVELLDGAMARCDFTPKRTRRKNT